MGILATYTIYKIPLFQREILKRILLLLFFSSAVPVILYVLYIRIQSINYYISIYTLPNLYIPKNIYNSLQFIKSNIPKNSNIISSQYIGSMIPSYSLNVSFIGHFVDTSDYDKKRSETIRFYSMKMTNNEALELFKKYEIEYVYYGTDEKMADNFYYPFLTEIYEQDGIQIFKVSGIN